MVSVRTFSVMYDHPFSKFSNHPIRHKATHKVGCQPGDCIWLLRSSSGVCTGMYGLTYSLYYPREVTKREGSSTSCSNEHANRDILLFLGLFVFL